MMIQLLLVNIFFIAWSHFLNYIGTFLLHSQQFFNCYSCKKNICWKAIIPFQQTQCPCDASFFYKPFTFTILGLLIFNGIYTTQDQYIFSSLIFSSFLFICIRTDAETSLLSRFTTIYPMPLFLLASYFNLLPITFLESVAGITLGYCFLYAIRSIFFHFAQKEGLGIGDIELIALIGSFLGPLGVWFSIFLGSVLGSCIILIQRCFTKKNIQQIPFGPFLSISALAYLIFKIETLIINFL